MTSKKILKRGKNQTEIDLCYTRVYQQALGKVCNTKFEQYIGQRFLSHVMLDEQKGMVFNYDCKIDMKMLDLFNKTF